MKGPPDGQSAGTGTAMERPEGRGFLPEDTLEWYQRIDKVLVAAVVEMRAVGADYMS